jgi:diacylglycerol kinase family enzyme
LRAIAGHRNVRAATGAFASLSVMKTQFLSGSFRFDTPVEPADGLFAVNVCGPLGRLGLLRVLWNLQRGRFRGVPGCSARRAPAVIVETGAPIPAEIDGEIVQSRRFEISILPERIRVCV